MKKLFQLLAVIALLFAVNVTYAQTIGVKGGLNLAKMLIEDDEDTYSDDFDFKPGFHLGVTAEFPVNDMFSLETGALLSTKGYKAEMKETFLGETYEYKTNVNLMYIDIPIMGRVNFDVGGTKIYGNLGPYIGVALSGKAKAEYTENGETEKEEVDLEIGSDEDEDDLRRLDFGLMIGAGVEINSLQIGVSYGYGLANVSPYTEDGSKIQNRVLGVSLGYKFGGSGSGDMAK